MSIQVENNLKNTDDKDIFKQRAHFVPCKIEEDGPANVELYFEPYIVKKDDGELKCTFRGRPLDGTPMELPAGYRFIVAGESKKPLSEDANRRFQVTGGFKELTYWNWDKKPTINDTLVKALDWTQIADAIHGD